MYINLLDRRREMRTDDFRRDSIVSVLFAFLQALKNANLNVRFDSTRLKDLPDIQKISAWQLLARFRSKFFMIFQEMKGQINRQFQED